MNLKPYNSRKAKESFSALFFIPHKKRNLEKSRFLHDECSYSI